MPCMASPVDGPGSPSLPVTANNHEEQPSTSALSQDQVLPQPISQTSPEKRHADAAPNDGPPIPPKKIKKFKRSDNKIMLHKLNEGVHLNKVTYNKETFLPDYSVVNRVDPSMTAPVWIFFVYSRLPFARKCNQ